MTDKTAETLNRITETLEGASVMLLRTIDAETRQNRPKLRIWHDGGGCLAQWDGHPEFSFTDFVQRQTIRFGEFNGHPAIAASQAIATLVAYGQLSLPGFITVERSNITTCVYNF